MCSAWGYRWLWSGPLLPTVTNRVHLRHVVRNAICGCGDRIKQTLMTPPPGFHQLCSNLCLLENSDPLLGDPNSIPGSGRSTGEGIGYPLQYSWASLVAQLVKNLPAMRETWVWSLGWEDPLEEAWQPTLVFLPGESRGQGSLVGYSPWGYIESDMSEQWTHTDDSDDGDDSKFLNFWYLKTSLKRYPIRNGNQCFI